MRADGRRTRGARAEQRLLGVLALVTALGSCRVRREEPPTVGSVSAGPVASAATRPPPPARPSATARVVPREVEVPPGAEVVAIGGVESSPDDWEPLVAAVRVATAQLVNDGPPLEAAVAGVAVLEDAPTLNAGVGSHLRFDGETIECDAAVMTGGGRFAAVGALRQTRYPVRVAQALLDTPHRILVGEGAERFAREVGLAPFPLLRPSAMEHHRELMASLAKPSIAEELEPAGPESAVTGASSPSGAESSYWRSRVTRSGSGAPAASVPTAAASASVSVLPVATSPPSPGSDTVAVLVRGERGVFAGAVSSGGTVPALPGRLGDVIVPGAALWAGAEGAVAVSGHGEEVMERRLAERVFERLRIVASPRLAAEWGLAQLKQPGAVVVLGRTSSHLAATSSIAWARNGRRGEASSRPAEQESVDAGPNASAAVAADSSPPDVVLGSQTPPSSSTAAGQPPPAPVSSAP